MSGRLVRAAALTTRRRRTAPQATRRAAPSDANGRVDAARDAVKLLTAAQKWRSLREALADADVDDEDVDDDDLVAISAFDLDSGDALSETQKKYASKIADALAAKAAQLASKQRAGSEGLRAGQALYERGMYAEAASQLETALDAAGQSTSLGGETALWLALAYDAAGRHDACVALYLLLEQTHPAQAVRKQAAELRFIAEAPKLEIGADERVSIPSVTGDDYRDKWARSAPPRRRPPPRSWEDEFWARYTPPVTTPNRYVLAATSVLCFALALYSAMYIRH